MAFTFVSALAALALAAVANAESHTISFDNKCGKGTPQLIQGGKVISTGEPYTSNGPFSAGIAYLQTGECLFNGENCALLEMTLGNPTCPGCGSSTDISLIPPHALNVPVAFAYQGGCAGQGATCTTANCNTAFFVPDDTQVQVACQTDNVDLLITFCPDGSSDSSPASSSSAAPSSSSKPAQSSASDAAPSPSSTSASVRASPSSSAAPAPTSSAAPTAVVAAAPSPSASSSSSTVPNRGTCKNKTRRSASRMAREHRRRLTGLSH